MSDPSRDRPQSPADIERQLDVTRAELALTFNALERQLAARHLVQKGFAMFTDSLGGYDGLNRMIRANPVPIALIGIGAAWLIASNTRVVERIAEDERVEAVRRRATELAGNVGSRAGELAANVADRVGLGGQSADRPLGETGNLLVDEFGRRRPDGWVHQMTDMAEDALRTARDSGGAMLDRASGFAGERAGRVADQLSDAFARNPLMIGAVGIMAGALIAALLPASRVEDEWLGGTRDELWQKAQQAGEEAMAQLRDTAARAADAAADAATQTVEREMDKPSHV